MKIAVTVLAISLIASFCQASFSADPAEREEFRDTGRRRISFKGIDEGIVHFQNALLESKGTSMSAIYKSLEIETDSDKFEKALSEYEQKFTEFFKQAGGLRNVDVCRTAPLGNSIQRVGYILNYDHNLMFADSWFINSSYGWILASAYFHFSSDASDTLNKIPNAYFEE